MSSLGHWMPEDGFHLLQQQQQGQSTKHSVRTRSLAGKKQHLGRRQQAQDHFCGSCHCHHPLQYSLHHHQKSNVANDTDHRACKGQSSSSFSWRSDLSSEPLARGVCFSLSSSSSSSLSSSSSSICPELVFEQSLKTVTAQTAANQTLWRPLSSGSSSSSSSSQNSYCGSDDGDIWSNSLEAPTKYDTCRHYNSSPQYNAHRGGGGVSARAHMGIGGRGTMGGGTGENPDPSSSSSSGVHPGNSGLVRNADGSNGSSDDQDRHAMDMDGMADEDGKKQPSSYTFRRRNAVVEGSEDAPRAKDFYPDASRN